MVDSLCLVRIELGRLLGLVQRIHDLLGQRLVQLAERGSAPFDSLAAAIDNLILVVLTFDELVDNRLDGWAVVWIAEEEIEVGSTLSERCDGRRAIWAVDGKVIIGGREKELDGILVLAVDASICCAQMMVSEESSPVPHTTRAAHRRHR